MVHRQHPGDEGPFLLQWVRDQLGQHVHAVHRLDRPTAGLMLFARSPEASGALSLEFRERRAVKKYLAVVRGYLETEGVIDYALGPVRDRHAREASTERPAVTRWRSVARSEIERPVGRYETARYSLLELKPETGRRHQLRRHLKHIFHPILGDRKYGDRDHNRFLRELGFDRLVLVSTGLALPDLDLSFEASPDPDWTEIASTLGLSVGA